MNHVYVHVRAFQIKGERLKYTGNSLIMTTEIVSTALPALHFSTSPHKTR